MPPAQIMLLLIMVLNICIYSAGGSFLETILSSSAAQKSVKARLLKAGLYRGQALHGLRRGRIQSASDQALPLESIKRLAQIKTTSIVHRYADVSAHLNMSQCH